MTPPCVRRPPNFCKSALQAGFRSVAGRQYLTSVSMFDGGLVECSALS
jgi:hypothetical protein